MYPLIALLPSSHLTLSSLVSEDGQSTLLACSDFAAPRISITSCGSYEPPRIEAGGLSTLVYVHRGHKYVIYGIQSDESDPRLSLEDTDADGEHWPWLMFTGYSVRTCTLGPGASL